MNKLEFIRMLDAGTEEVSDQTADLWYHILGWVQTHRYADTADTPEFIQHVQAFRHLEPATIGRHLSRMAKAGFLRAHTVRRRLSQETREEVASSLTAMLFGGEASTLPSSFKRYTLPGMPCPLEFKTADALLARNRRLDEELVGHLPAKLF